MKEQFVTYELALKLKELGFDEECFGYYYPDAYSTETILCDSAININHTYYNEFPDRGDVYSTDNFNEQFVSAPLWQQAFDWFRKTYRIDSHVYSGVRGFTYRYNNYYDRFDGTFDVTPFTGEILDFENREYAKLACLKKLIELVENL